MGVLIGKMKKVEEKVKSLTKVWPQLIKALTGVHHKGSFLSIFLKCMPCKWFGSVAEWSNALVLKTSVLKGTRGSNPCASADKVFGVKFLGTPDSKSNH